MRKFNGIVLMVLMVIMVFGAESAFASSVKITDTEGVPRGLKMVDGQLQLYSVGENSKIFFNDTDNDGTADVTDGTWQPVYLPSGEEAKSVLLQVHSGLDTVYDVESACSSFIFSHTNSGTPPFIYSGNEGLQLSVGVQEDDSPVLLGYIKVTAAKYIAILILY